MTFALKNRYGETVGVGQSSSAGGTQMVNVATLSGPVTLTASNASGDRLGRPFQVLANNSGGTTQVILPPPNSCLGQKFYIAETQNVQIDVQSPGGSTIFSIQQAAVVVIAMNNAANNGAAWYVASAA